MTCFAATWIHYQWHQCCVPFTVHMDNCDKQTVIANTAKFIQSEYIDYRLYLNTLRTKQKGWHFANNISKCIFVNENHCILVKLTQKSNPRSPIDKSALAWWFLKPTVTQFLFNSLLRLKIRKHQNFAFWGECTSDVIMEGSYLMEIDWQHFLKHIEAETKWSPFSRWQVWMDSLEWKCMNCY